MLESVTLERVHELEDLIDPKTNKYYTCEVNVSKYVLVKVFTSQQAKRIPVKFGKIGFDIPYITPLMQLQFQFPRYFFWERDSLTSLEGAPREITGSFSCDDNKILSLEGIHKIIKKINGQFYCNDNPIKSGGIGLLLIEGITRIGTNHPALEIINKYIGQGKKGLLLCQEELIEAGFEANARL